MKFKRILIPLLLIILMTSTVAFGSNVPLGPYFDDTYFDLSDSALILKVVPHEKGGLEVDVSVYDGLLKISGGSTSAVTDNSANWNTAYDWGDHSGEGYLKVITGESIGDLTDVDLTDIANEKILQYNFTTEKWECETSPAGNGGYTNLTEFIDQTAWRLFYSNNLGDVTELAFGANGQYLKSTGATSAPIFDTPSDAGDMLKATYDTDADDIVDKSETVDDGAGNSSTAADVKDAVTKKHSQNTDTDLDSTFEATFVKKADNVNVLADITSSGADIEDAVIKKHTQNTDTQFNFYNALSSDHTWSGDKDTQPVGEPVTFGDLLYPDWTAGEWLKADADLAAKMPGLRIALESKTDGQTCLMLVKGYIRDDSAFEFTASMVYASVTPGTMSSTAPSAGGNQLQRVGVAKSASVLFFDPSIDVAEIKP